MPKNTPKTILLLILLQAVAHCSDCKQKSTLDLYVGTPRLDEISRMASTKIFTCDFEVFGRVQGVFFRKCTQQQAKTLKVRGWCMNTHAGTVKGQLEGTTDKLNEMKHWLEKTGSPSSQIEKAVFSETKAIENYTFPDFDIKR